MRLLLYRIPGQFETETQFRNPHDPNRPPPAEPGDKYVVLGLLVRSVPAELKLRDS